MFKNILNVLKNQAKIRALDVLLEVLINTLQEFRRAQNSGQFDVNNNATAPRGGDVVDGKSDFFTKFNSKNSNL